MYEGFDDWADVQERFSMNDPEPQAVIWAEYDNGGYDGQAYVFYYNEGKFWYNEGSHCSCYGLEDQWDPEEYSLETLKGQMERATYGFFVDRKELIVAAVDRLSHPIAEMAARYSSLANKAADAEARIDAAEAELAKLEPQLEDLRGQMRQILK